MSAHVETGVSAAAPPRAAAWRQPHLVLLGTGAVGTAFVHRHARLRGRLALPPLAVIANSREARACGEDALAVLPQVSASRRAASSATAARDATQRLRRGDIVVDATASDAVADHHADWLAHGVHVVTANKLGLGAGCDRAQRIARSLGAGDARYGDAATVGAGLPLLRTIRGLVEGGDRVLGIQGLLSGSLAWLLGQFDGSRPFSALVREARAAGYTEPDPRVDLSGEDVRRKLLILARAAGMAIAPAAVRVSSLLPEALARADTQDIDAWLPALDTVLAAREHAARTRGERLCFVARVDASDAGAATADVGLRALPSSHPLCAGEGTDNRVAITTERYGARPLVVQGPGAGAAVTAAALLDDVAAIHAADRALARALRVPG